nr:MAG TPA: hypothetical protein [Bacteriophage sp.]
MLSQIKHYAVIMIYLFKIIIKKVLPKKQHPLVIVCLLCSFQ